MDGRGAEPRGISRSPFYCSGLREERWEAVRGSGDGGGAGGARGVPMGSAGLGSVVAGLGSVVTSLESVVAGLGSIVAGLACPLGAPEPVLPRVRGGAVPAAGTRGRSRSVRRPHPLPGIPGDP